MADEYPILVRDLFPDPKKKGEKVERENPPDDYQFQLKVFDSILRDYLCYQGAFLFRNKNKKLMLSHLADLQELIYEGAKLLKLTPEEFETYVKEKREKEGGYSKRLIYTSLDPKTFVPYRGPKLPRVSKTKRRKKSQ